MKKNLLFLSAIAIGAALTGCKDEEVVLPADYTDIPAAEVNNSDYSRLYVLNEGNMGSNKCTLDYLDFENGIFAHNIYAEKNPNVAMGLGDAGNDLLIHDGKMYISVSGSGKIEIVNARTVERIGQVDIAQCRYLEYADGYIYASSWTGGYTVNPEEKKGAIYRIDPNTMSVSATLPLVFWPEEMTAVDGKLYVATSGQVEGAAEYGANSVMVIDLATFTVEREITVAPNLHHIEADTFGNIWVSSRGDYVAKPSRLYRLQKANGEYGLNKEIPTGCSAFAIYGDKIYLYAHEWSNATMGYATSYNTVDINTAEVLPTSYLAASETSKITTPYAITVNPQTGEIFLADAKNYTSSGALNCIGKDGKIKYSATTGDIPGHFAFLKR